MCSSPVENVIGMQHVLSMVDVVDPLNILSGITFSRYKNFNLFFSANVSFTKLCDDPESKSARNSWSGVGGIIICHMNHLWSPVPGPG